jgi:trans-aconitate methyltransferase
VKEKFSEDYESQRWFSTKLYRERYRMMEDSISYHLKDIKYRSCFEIGPGPGTWTKLLLKHSPNSFYRLLDISGEMHKQFQKKIGIFPNIDYQIGDFESYKDEKTYDFFFSSRTIEYITNKEKAISNINSILSPGKEGMIITKTPHYLKKKILMQKTPWQHMNQISPKELDTLLKKYNFRNIQFYPVIIYVPLLGRLNIINRIIWNFVYKIRLNFITQFISEAYLVKFTKVGEI